MHKTVSWATEESEFHPTSHKAILSETYEPSRQRMIRHETLATMNDTQNGTDIDANYISKKNRNLGSKRENNKSLKDLVVIEIPTR